MSAGFVAFDIDLPATSSVELDAESGALHLEIETHNDATTLTLLCDVLRAAVVQVEDARARLAQT